jgi:hypothetical protein
MSDSTRPRINSAFEEELGGAPVPPGLRAMSVRAAVTSRRERSPQPVLLALVAAFVAVALVATLVIGSHVLRSTTPAPAGSTTPPPARSGAAVALDQARGIMVLFGGSGDQGAGPRADTWTFDGRLWRQMHPKVSPSGRIYFAMAYDAGHGNVVLFGGMAQVSAGKAGLQGTDDTWTWNGSTWTEQHPAHEPGFGYEWGPPQMQFDPISHALLMYGFTKATSESNTGIHAELWSWNGTDWNQLSVPADAASGAVLMQGGDRVLLVGARTWAWAGSTWVALNPRVNLPPDPVVTSAYDPKRHQLVVLDGGDTWVWDGSTWARQHPTVQPPAMGYMAYIPALARVISWADTTSGFDYGTYAWNGTDWTQISPARNVLPQSGGKGGYYGVMSPAQAATKVRDLVKNTQPVLLPAYVPSFVYDAAVNATADTFSIRYQSDERDRSIDFGIVVPNPPVTATGSDRFVKFRHALPTKAARSGYAEYYVYNPSDPTSARWLLWIEPGTMQSPELAGAGVPYFLSATGMTDAEFWQVANSLR